MFIAFNINEVIIYTNIECVLEITYIPNLRLPCLFISENSYDSEWKTFHNFHIKGNSK